MRWPRTISTGRAGRSSATCIYDVDLNPMALELAKLSLWLTTVASNKPLSFLDHHLRCGNSLIGAQLDKITVLPGGEKEQKPLWSYGLKSHTDGLLKRYSLMAALPDDSLPMVKWKEDQFRQIKESELSRRLNELCNVWLSTYFGTMCWMTITMSCKTASARRSILTRPACGSRSGFCGRRRWPGRSGSSTGNLSFRRLSRVRGADLMC